MPSNSEAPPVPIQRKCLLFPVSHSHANPEAEVRIIDMTFSVEGKESLAHNSGPTGVIPHRCGIDLTQFYNSYTKHYTRSEKFEFEFDKFIESATGDTPET